MLQAIELKFGMYIKGLHSMFCIDFDKRRIYSLLLLLLLILISLLFRNERKKLLYFTICERKLFKTCERFNCAFD